MTATGPAIMDAEHAVAVASIEGDLSSHVAQLQKTVRLQQAKIDDQDARLHHVETLVARLMARLAAPVFAGATAAPVAASAPAGPAAACASTSVGTVAAQDTLAAEGMVAAAASEPDGMETPRSPELVTCNICWQATTYICAHATVDDPNRAGCMKLQGWTKGRSSRRWRCPPCTLKECAPPNGPPDQWPDECWRLHGKPGGAASSMSMPSPAPPPEPVASPAAEPAPTHDPWQPSDL